MMRDLSIFVTIVPTMENQSRPLEGSPLPVSTSDMLSQHDVTTLTTSRSDYVRLRLSYMQCIASVLLLPSDDVTF